ncbi:class I adenylate-forming enzyme family protein [Paraburkholderia sp. GAS334]|uniref:class I adenylate-forming enzyme family protein n=1 Tax=Paraburkholderia sp. GAS334 TaxID=3035131 RepID=UPI003D1F6A15
MSSTSQPVADPPYRTVAVLLEQHRRRTPEKPAIVDVDDRKSISFEELAGVVDGIGRQLLRRGIKKGERVVLAGTEGLDKLLLWLGIWRIGAVVCPLDVSFVRPAIARTLIDTIAPALVLAPANGDDSICAVTDGPVTRFAAWSSTGADEAAPETLRLDSDDRDDVALPEGATASAPGDIASMCCTSGTTGMPKIVVYDHACYWLNSLDSIDLLGLNVDDRALEYRSFDWYSAQILSLMPFLQLGSTLYVARRFSMSRFADWIKSHRVTVSAGVPTVLNMLLEAPVDTRDGTFATLRAMTCSTAPLSPVQWARFEKHYGIRILNLYGSSEAGWMCGNRTQRRRIGTVGYPVAHIEFDIVDPDGVSCGPDVEGQVVVSGPKLALGLLCADGTIKPIRGAPLFTRDVAARDADGFVRMAARMDDLIIRGGVKIVPQEIEDAMLGHPDVQDVAALGVPDPVYGQESVCFVVPHPGTAPDAEELRAYCRAHLPREKWPKHVYLVASLPRNARSKILRDELRQQWWQIVNTARDLPECE